MGKANTKPELGNYTFDQKFARKKLGSMIILHEYPLSIVDHMGFRRYSSALQPLFKVPTRNTIKNDIMKIYDHERVQTMKLLEEVRSRIAITTDLWTSGNQKKGFMAVTSHFIDEDFVLQSRLLRKKNRNPETEKRKKKREAGASGEEDLRGIRAVNWKGLKHEIPRASWIIGYLLSTWKLIPYLSFQMSDPLTALASHACHSSDELAQDSHKS
ncbi:hypothetical protein RJ639_007682 [Escallonia herrerae]|uniref:Uncharacterized protein n=1 Tax=Escallonia herrerae TaxID=1293975 RepID=A0AA88VYQ2_9ASTE|nr:hypothetical protein RJ639_007682 [Escallonia herrerae]